MARPAVNPMQYVPLLTEVRQPVPLINFAFVQNMCVMCI